MTDSEPRPQDEAVLDGFLGGGVAGPETGVSAGVDEAERAEYGATDLHRAATPPTAPKADQASADRG